MILLAIVEPAFRRYLELWTKFSREVILATGNFCILQELFFAIVKLVFSLGIKFCNFREAAFN